MTDADDFSANAAAVAALKDAITPGESASRRLELFVLAYAELVRDNPTLAEVLTIELRQSNKFMRETSNPRFAELLRLLAGVIEEGQTAKTIRPDIPASIAARALFGMLDELVLAWVLGGGEKFDIVRAAEWIGCLTLQGIEKRSSS